MCRCDGRMCKTIIFIICPSQVETKKQRACQLTYSDSFTHTVHSLPPHTCFDMLESFTGKSLPEKEAYLISLHRTESRFFFFFFFYPSVIGSLCMRMSVCVFCVSAPLSRRTWGAVCDEHAEAYANIDNNQALPNSLPNSIQTCYLLLVMLMVTKNVTEKDIFKTLSSC